MSHQDKPLSLEEYKRYKKLFEKCLTIPEEDIDETPKEEYNE